MYVQRLLVGAVLAVAMAACGGASSQAKTDGPAEAAANLPEQAVCPVSGETFKPDANTKTVAHNGETYYMCCPGCAGKFAANPSAFIKSEAAGEQAEPAAEPAGEPAEEPTEAAAESDGGK